MRIVRLPVHADRFAALQDAPQLHRNLLRPRADGVKQRRTRQMKLVADAGHLMPERKGRYRQPNGGKRRIIVDDFMQHDGAAQRRRNHPQPGDYALQPNRAVDVQRRCPPGFGDGKQHPRQPGAVVGVVVRQQNGINTLYAPRQALYADLRALSAVHQHRAAAHAHIQARQRAIRQGHRAARAQRAKVNHPC